MTSPSKYKVVVIDQDEQEGPAYPEIVVNLDPDTPSLTWREAKKELRKWYLEKAKALRSVTEKSYFE